ncbi:MAG: hypothetical protein ACI8SE_001322 [Bacteroidia bacterium]|jgi:hypothetical protein
MRTQLLILCAVFMFGCSDSPVVDCDGFANEPSMTFKASTNDTLGIFFLNADGAGDTAFAHNGETLSIPIDMNSDTMFYDILGYSNLGRLVFVYSLVQEYCKTSDQLKQFFKSTKFTPQSTYLNVQTVIDGSSTDIDTSAGYASFLNQTRTVSYFKIDL